MTDDVGFDLGFDYDPLTLAAQEFLQVAQVVGELQARADQTARATLSGHRQRLAPLIERATGAIAAEVQSIASDVRPIAASAPNVGPDLLIVPGGKVPPGGIPPMPKPVPPVGGMPPVVQPGGQAWIVMITDVCGPDSFMVATTQVVRYIDGQPVNPPPGSRPGPVFNELPDALAWANDFVASYPRTPCGKPPAPEPEPQPPTLPPFGCPPPSCVPVCPAPEPEPPKADYCVWYRLDPLDCLVLSADQKEPPDTTYKKDRCYPTAEEAEERAAALCKQFGKDQGQPFEPTPGVPPGSFCDSRTWDDSDFLAQLSGFFAQISDQAVRGVNPAGKMADFISTLLDYILPFWIGGAGRDAFERVFRQVTEPLFGTGEAVAASLDCKSNDLSAVSAVNMFLSIVSKWIGNIPPRATASLQYAEAYLCPWLLPSAGEAQALFQAGVIDEQTAINLGRVNGRCDDTTRVLLDAGQSRLSPGEVVDAYRRKAIDRGRAEAELRARGYLRTDALETYLATSRFIPGPSDLVRFLVRDAFDEAGVVREFDLDAEFDAKWPESGPGREFADAFGVEREVLKYFWRAHWSIPSPTQLSEFWKRLRPGEPVDPDRARRIGLTDVIPSWSPRANPELQVTSDQIDLALGQQDILPYWRDKFRAVQFNPLTRVDARRAYDIGVLGVDDIYESLIQGGYREADALVLTEFAVKEKNLGIRSSEPAKLFIGGLASEDETRIELTDLGFDSGAIDRFVARETRGKMRSARALPEFSEFVAGTLDEPELRDALTERFFSASQVDELVESAKRLARVRFRGACTDAAKTRFLWGELDEDGAKRELRGFGWSVFAADEIVNGWTCELAVSDRLPTVRQLLQWAESGVIGPVDFRQRMRRLRYADADIDRFLAQAAEL